MRQTIVAANEQRIKCKSGRQPEVCNENTEKEKNDCPPKNLMTGSGMTFEECYRRTGKQIETKVLLVE